MTVCSECRYEVVKRLEAWVQEVGKDWHSALPKPRHDQSRRHFAETWMARWQRRTGVRPDEVEINRHINGKKK